MRELKTDRQLEVMLNCINDGVFTVDNNWSVTFFNDAAERITGISRQDALGSQCCDVFRSNICEGKCALRSTLKTGRPVVNKAIYIIDAADKRVPISISTAILHNQDNEIIGGVETFRDLSTVEQLKKELEKRYSFEDIISKNPLMHKLFDILPIIARSHSTILIEGASGTGKELFARAIHSLSPRKKSPFIIVNCASIPDTLLESELFGYKKGAFTGANKDKPGRFALAEKGTIFLDEIGDISPLLQVRLLRFLQEKTYEPLGGIETLKSDVRVLAATNKNLSELVSKGSFREDLFYRLNVIALQLPPLKNRKEDLPLLTGHFISKFCRLYNKDIAGVTPEVTGMLMNYDFPGNVRELENIIEHAFILCPESLISPEYLPLSVIDEQRQPEIGFAPNVEEFEKQLIIHALQRNLWNRKAAAEELGVHKTTLHRKIKKLHIDLPEADGRSAWRKTE